jgi:phage terminase large subunit-like protein
VSIPSHFLRTAADHLALEQGCYFSEEHAQRIVSFVERFSLPQFTGKRFKLLQWQADWLSQLEGWRLPDGRRRWRKALLTCGKKNGKTLLQSGNLLFELLASGVPSPLVISCSTTRQNASQIFDEIKHSIHGSEPLSKLCQVRPSSKLVRVKKLNGEFRSISNEAGNAEGLNLSFAACDEVHAWKSDRLYRALEYAGIARPDGCLTIISTAGHDQGHFFYDLVQKARNVLSGADTDTSFFATIYEPNEGDDPEDPATWAKANPSLGTSFTAEDFRRDLEAAKKNLPDWLSFCRYRLNMWCQASDSWLDLDKWDKAKGTITDEQLAQCPCWLSCDLSSTTDPTSVSIVWALPGNKFFIKSWAWVCAAGVRRREATNLPRYQDYAEAGWMRLTDGDVIDQHAVKNFILDACSKYQVQEIVFDSYNAGLLATELLAVKPVFYAPQNYKFFNSVCKQFEMGISEGHVQHDGNRLLRWAAKNVRLDRDAWGNVKPSRDKSTDKIDPMISALMGYARASEWAASGASAISPYETAGIDWW